MPALRRPPQLSNPLSLRCCCHHLALFHRRHHPARRQELEEAHSSAADTVATARQQTEAITRENTRLRAELQSAMDRLARGGTATGASASPASSLSSSPARSGAEGGTAAAQGRSFAFGTVAAQMQELYELAAQECAVMRQEVAALAAEAGELRSALDEREAGTMSLLAQNRALAGTLAQAQDSIRTLDAERSAAEAQVQELAAATASARTQVARADADARQLRAALAQREAQIRDYRTAIEELSSQANVSASHWSPARCYGYGSAFARRAAFD
jgi:chromosome segregation ATPase